MNFVSDKAYQLPYLYRIAGLNVAADTPLSTHLRLDTDASLQVDAVIRLGDVPERLDNVLQHGANWWVADQYFLLVLPGIGRFLVSHGREIIMQPAPDIAVTDILVFATGTAFAALLYQRGESLLLHGSAVVYRNQAYVFCGASGVGKSTLAAALLKAGCDFLADDICLVKSTSNGKSAVYSDGQVLRLYPDSIEHIGLGNAQGSAVRQMVNKFHVSVHSGAAPSLGGVPLAAIYMLAETNSALPVGISRQATINAAQLLLRQSYRRRLAFAIADKGQFAKQTTAILASVNIYQLVRPRELTSLDGTVAELIAQWDQLSSEVK
jgi:hypothetical protein